jgi:hypothetical protein
MRLTLQAGALKVRSMRYISGGVKFLRASIAKLAPHRAAPAAAQLGIISRTKAIADRRYEVITSAFSSITLKKIGD